MKILEIVITALVAKRAQEVESLNARSYTYIAALGIYIGNQPSKAWKLRAESYGTQLFFIEPPLYYFNVPIERKINV